MSNDLSAPARLAVFMSSYYITTAMKVGALAASAQASRLERQRQYEQQLVEAELKVLELEDDLAAAEAEADVAALRDQAELVTLASELEQGIVRELVGLLENETNAALAYERDLVELRDRRDEANAKLIELQGLHIEVLQAQLDVERAFAQYDRVVQRAQLVSARLANVRTQAENLNQIDGSPAAVFAWANRLTRAEQRLERAKDVLSEWLVALEYFAVQPFMDQRIQLLGRGRRARGLPHAGASKDATDRGDLGVAADDALVVGLGALTRAARARSRARALERVREGA